MTLYFWMHWFWITNSLTLIVQSRPTVMSTGTTIHYITNESSNPPTTPLPFNQTTATGKPSKLFLKKHLIKNITTVDPPAIDQNFTIPSMDNDTMSTTNHSYFENNTITELDYTSEHIPQNNLSAAGITGITVGCIGIVGIVCGVSFIMYRNRGLNRPQVLNDRCSNPDSSGYIDDASIRDNSEEMYSLDNDSFLNSLEAMTIQNYWTDTVKHTKL